MPVPAGAERVRLAELLLGLTAVADVGMGQPIGSAARTCAAAVGLAERAGCDVATRFDVYFGLMRQLGVVG